MHTTSRQPFVATRSFSSGRSDGWRLGGAHSLYAGTAHSPVGRSSHTAPWSSTWRVAVAASKQEQAQRAEQPAPQPRRQFGPEPPPPKPVASTQEHPSSAPKRRGRPPKSGAAAGPAAATGAGQPNPSASAPSASPAASSTRRPFGPEPPPPATDPSASPDLLDLPLLPEDPYQLSVDDILSIPLPDPRAGQAFTLGSDIDDLELGEEGEEGGGLGDGEEGGELDLDYEQLITLGTRVNAARYIERAFERAKRGLEPTPDPLAPEEELEQEEAEVEVKEEAAASGGRGGATQARTHQQQQQQQQQQAAASGSGGAGEASTRSGAGAGEDAAGSGVPTAVGGAALPGGSPSIAVSVGDDDTDDAGAAAATAAAPSRPSVAGVLVDLEAEDEFSPPSQPASSASVPAAPSPHPSSSASDAGAAAGPDPSSPSPSSPPSSPPKSEADEAAARRRVELLVGLLAASGTELEAALEAAAPEVDEQLIALLQARYATSLRLKQDAATSERIASLLRVLRYILERRNSSATERLLDDVLGILMDSEAQPDPVRRRGDAAARLRSAFTGGVLELDVFTAAEALAGARQAAAEAMSADTEAVSVESFKAEAMALLDHAKRVQAQTAEALAAIEAEVARLRREDPAALGGREWAGRLQQAELARAALGDRQGSISALEEAVLLTRAIEVQMVAGRMKGA